jgi:hypothetical protein
MRKKNYWLPINILKNTVCCQKIKIIKVNFFLRKIVGIGAREFNVCAVNDFFNNIPIFCEFS